MQQLADSGRVTMLGVMLAGICLAAPAQAQFTLMGGRAWSTMSAATTGFGSLGSVVGGLSVGIGTDRIGIRPGLLGLEKVTAHPADPDVPRGYAWIEAPVVAEWRFPTGAVTLVALAGGFLAARPRCWTDHCSDGIASYDHGLVFGTGLRLPGRPTLGVELRYDLGLAGLYPERQQQSRSRAFMALVTLGF